MNPINAVKRRFARRMSRSKMVKNFILKELLEDEKALEDLGKKPSAFEHILNGAGRSQTSLIRFIDHPEALARLMRSPKAFEKLLEAVSRNPESLFRVLEQRNVRSNLVAQNKFLAHLAGDRKIFMRMVEKVGPTARADAIQILVGDDAEQLRGIEDEAEASIAAILYRLGSRNGKDEPNAVADERIISALAKLVGSKAPDVIFALTEANPDLLAEGPLHDQAMRSIRTSAKSLSQLVAIYAVNPANGNSPGERVNKLMMQMLQEPVILHALLKDKKLRQNMFYVLQDSIEAAGDNVSDLMNAPRGMQVENAQ